MHERFYARACAGYAAPFASGKDRDELFRDDNVGLQKEARFSSAVHPVYPQTGSVCLPC